MSPGASDAAAVTAVPAHPTLSKHHGCGNDFLVLVDLENRYPIFPEMAVALCDRRRGVGADGFIRASAPVEDGRFSKPYEVAAVMELLNADGSRAEMSGNGVRCLGQALWDAGLAHGDQVLVATDAGMRKLTLHGMGAPGVASISVTMGEVVVGDPVSPDQLAWMDAGSRRAVRRAVTADVGNPHLVLEVEDVEKVDLDAVGIAAQAAFDGGINVEVIAAGDGVVGGSRGVAGGGAPAALDMAVYERGVGRTLACGTGSCAAAAAARLWGIAGQDGTPIAVRNPGGVLEVTLDADQAVLGGPVVHVADVTVDVMPDGPRGRIPCP